MACNILAIVQARMGSKRFPGKVLKKIDGRSLIEILLKRLSSSKRIDDIILATTDNSQDDVLADDVKNMGFPVFRGSTDDVLDRYYKAAMIYKPKTIIRITGDCPLIDPELVDKVIYFFEDNELNFLENFGKPNVP